MNCSPSLVRADVAAVWRIVIGTLMLVGSALPLPAQFIKGKVLDSENRDAVRSAFVSLIDTSATIVVGTAVDSRGRFTIRVREPGVYAVATTGTGYVTQLSKWIQLSAADSFEVNVRLARAVNTLPAVVVEAQRDSIRKFGIPGINARIVAGTVVTPMEVDVAARSAGSAYDVLQTLNISTLELKTFYIGESPPGRRPIQPGMYRCIAYRRTGGCVTVVMNGQRYSSISDLLELDGLIGPQDISHIIFLRPSEAGLIYGEETTNGVLIIVRKGEH